MSIIGQRDFSSGFSPGDTSPYGTAGGGSAAPSPAWSDGIAPFSPWRAPVAGTGSGAGTFGSDPSETGGFGMFVNSLVSTLQSALANLTQLFAGGGTSAQTANAGERYVRSATANSVGDPHDSLHGTTAGGATVSQAWDDMSGHGDLLDSDSIGGGYTVSTTATQRSANGVTLNASATVALQNGSSSVTFNADGTYGIVANGSTVALQRGQSLALGDGERVTIGDDSSVTVSAANASGGSISTTMRTNGAGGVDVTDSANDVDLGGYLVTRTDAAPSGSSGRPSPGYVPGANPVSYDPSSIEFT